MKWWLLVIFWNGAILNAQHRWDGEANNRKWSDPLNWKGDSLPSIHSSVLLDNFYVDSTYTILLDSASGTASIASLEIQPAGNKEIRLIIPTSHKSVPALNCVALNSLVIKRGGVLQNSSGASSGTIIQLADSVYLYNGSRYIHNTARAHASFVTLLATRQGTETGCFEFDVPTASTTISLSDRNFGKLVISSLAAGGTSNYTASGTRPIRVRSDLELSNGAKLNLNFTDTLHLGGNLVINKAVLNLSSSLRVLVLKMNGNIEVDAFSQVTETGSAWAEIMLQGKAVQTVGIKGTVLNDVRLMIDNNFGVVVNSPVVFPSRCWLKNGVLRSSAGNLFQLGPKGYFTSDTLNFRSFIEGPVGIASDSLRSYSVIPVGGGGILRWTTLRNWSGKGLVEYRREDPNLLGSVSNLDHISKDGYWKFSQWSGSVEKVELSFPDANYSGVTDLENLGCAKFNQSNWLGMDVLERRGSAGSNGSLLVNAGSWNTENLFVLGSYVAGQNPLPIRERPVVTRDMISERIKMEVTRISKNEISVNVHSKLNGRMSMVVYNVVGQAVWKSDLNVMKGRQNFSIRLPLHSPSIFHIIGLFWGVPLKTVSIFL